MLADFFEALAKAIETGTTLKKFRKDFDRIVAAHGWSYHGARGWRSRLIFQMDIRMAYAAGRWEQIQRLKKERPYLRYVTAGDERVHDAHRAWRRPAGRRTLVADALFGTARHGSASWPGSASWSRTRRSPSKTMRTTKKAVFELSGITTGTTRTYTLPNLSGALASIGTITQTFSGVTTFSAATLTFGSSTAASTTNVGSGATLAATLKTLNIARQASPLRRPTSISDRRLSARLAHTP